MNQRRKKSIQIEQSNQSATIGQNRTKVEPAILLQPGQSLAVGLNLLQIGDLGGEQTKEAPAIRGGLRHQNDSAAQVRRTLSGAGQAVQVENGNHLATIDKRSSENRRSTGERLQGDARHHLLNAPGIQGKTLAANLENECKHDDKRC